MKDLPVFYKATCVYRGMRLIGVFATLEGAKAACEQDANELVGKNWRSIAQWDGYDEDLRLDFDYYSYDVSRIQVQP